LQARQDYRVINLWEVDVEIAFQEPASPLLQFVPVLKGGASESTIQRALQVLRTDEELSNFETVMAFFASFVLESRLVRQIMRWDMAVLSESPFYQEILKQGMRQGIVSGIELGLELKFGSEGLQLLPEISQISDLERLKEIQRGLMTVNTLEELRRLI
jgi:predicted transposase YdaD